MKHDSEGLAQIHAYFKQLDKYDRYEYQILKFKSPQIEKIENVGYSI